MNRTECENLIAQKLWDIEQIYAQYNPEGKYLSMAIIKNDEYTSVMMNNSYYHDGSDPEIPRCIDADLPIDNRIVEYYEEGEEQPVWSEEVDI